MYCLSVIYPKLNGSTFDMDYYVNTHIPLAFALLYRKFAVKPQRLELLHNGRDAGNAANTAHHCIFNMYFDVKADAERMFELRQLLDEEKKSSKLRAEIKNFTTLAPEAIIFEVNRVEVQSTLSRGEALITELNQ